MANPRRVSKEQADVPPKEGEHSDSRPPKLNPWQEELFGDQGHATKAGFKRSSDINEVNPAPGTGGLVTKPPIVVAPGATLDVQGMRVSRSADGKTYDVQLDQTSFRRVCDTRGGLVQEGKGPAPTDRYKLETVREGTQATSTFLDQSGNRVTIAADGKAEVANKGNNSGFEASLIPGGYRYKHTGTTPESNFEFTISAAPGGGETVTWTDGNRQITAQWPAGAKPAGAHPFADVQPGNVSSPRETTIGALKESFVKRVGLPPITDKFGKTTQTPALFEAGSVTPNGTVVSIQENGSVSMRRPDGSLFTLSGIDPESGTYWVSTFGATPGESTNRRLGNGIVVSTGAETTRKTTDGLEITREGPNNTCEKWVKDPDGGFTYGKRDAAGWIAWQDSPEAAAHAKTKLAELQQKYNVKFTTAGASDIEGTDIQWRMPTMLELRGLEAALERSPQSASGANFHFYNGPNLKMGTAYHDRGDIVFGPQTALGSDHLLQSATDSTYGGRYSQSFEAVATHELAHHTGFKRNREEWLDGSYERRLGAQLGFEQIVDESPEGNHRTIWVRRAANGDLYKRKRAAVVPPDGTVADSTGEPTVWLHCDRNGKADPKDKPLDNRAMRDISAVKPPTDYADNPIEVTAEALTCLRLGRKSQERMLRESPAAYKVARREDQEEIDRTNLTLKDPFGHVLIGWMRDLTGHVVLRDKSTIDSVEAFERRGQGVRANPGP